MGKEGNPRVMKEDGEPTSPTWRDYLVAVPLLAVALSINHVRLLTDRITAKLFRD